MKATTPRVSVIVPLYKSERYLEATVASVLAQTEPSFELILVDDYSPDETYKLAQNLATKDARIKCLRHSENKGRPAFGRNTGIEVASGEFITFLDHDDSFEPEKLALMYEKVTAEKIDFLVSNCFLFSEKKQARVGTAWASVSGDVRKNFAKRLLAGNFVPPNSTLIRREMFQRVGMFDTTLKGVDDYDMWYRIARVSEADVISQPLATWRYENSQSISANDTLMIEDEAKFYTKIIDGKGEDWEIALAKKGLNRCQQRLAHRALARGEAQRAQELYEKAGALRLASLVKRAPLAARMGYHAKRYVDRLRQRDFQPLVLDFNAPS